MKQVVLVIALCCVFLSGKAQTGIGTTTPSASAKLEVASSTQGFLPPRLALTATNAASPVNSPATGLIVYNTATTGTAPNNVMPGYYFWNGTNWATIATALGSSQNIAGDIKSGIQQTDHSGWIKLDGRAKSSLTASQQARATALGIGTNLPDATNSYLSQNGGLMGAVSGSNTVVLSQANLPNVNFTGTSGNSGNHAHNVDPPLTYTNNSGNHYHEMPFNNDDYNGSGGGNQSLEDDGGGWSYRGTTWAGDHNHYVDIPNFTSSTNGDHNHSISVSSGGSGTAITVAPKTLSVTMFIYLGN
jgi:hypothetical protein|nr:hypothetical protein [uncultured Flavobacterium sp.]